MQRNWSQRLSDAAKTWDDLHALGALRATLDPVQESLAWLERDSGGPLFLEAVNALTVHHSRLVGKVMTDYGFRIDLDLFQEGVLAVRRMVLAFDRTRGVRFVTPAYRAIRNALLRHEDLHARHAPLRGAEPIWGQVGRGLMADASSDPVVLAMDAERLERVRWFLGRLPERERLYLELYYGFDGGGSRTFAEVGALVNPPVSYQWVAYVVMRATKRLERDMRRHDFTLEGVA